jgi:hypothetical protein
MPHVSPDSWKYWNESPEGATSLSGPHAAGVAALLLGLADDSNEPNDSRSEVIRAVIVNSTFPNINNKQGQSTNPLDPNNIWHGDRGYGRIDALRAYELLDSNRVSRTSIISQDKGWAYENISNSDTHNYLITATKNYRLVLTTTWNRKPTRSWNRVWGKYVYSDEVIPKFDIDVTVKDPNGAEIFSTPDNSPLYEFPNNLEKIDLLLLKDGQYEIIVENTSSKSRDYGMAFELIPPLTADFNHDYVVDTNDLSVLTDDWLETGSQADLAGQDDVDLKDFAVFAANWRNINSLYH